jgi:hypothetical protein
MWRHLLVRTTMAAANQFRAGCRISTIERTRAELTDAD